MTPCTNAAQRAAGSVLRSHDFMTHCYGGGVFVFCDLGWGLSQVLLVLLLLLLASGSKSVLSLLIREAC